MYTLNVNVSVILVVKFSCETSLGVGPSDTNPAKNKRLTRNVGFTVIYEILNSFRTTEAGGHKDI